MNSSPYLAEEEMILAVGDFPPVSSSLRARVLAAAASERRRRTLNRRKACTTGLLLAVLGTAYLYQPTILPVPRMAALHERIREIQVPALDETGYARTRSLTEDSGTQHLMVFVGISEWDLVESELRSRASHSQTFQGTFLRKDEI